jgi:drug/metabolite transporter (DMT)-like permease
MRKTWLADTTLLVITLIWGATFVVVQNAVEMLPPNLFNALRFGVATAFLLAIRPFLPAFRDVPFSPRLILAGMFLGLWLFGGYAFQTVGLLYTTPSKAGFITGLSVVLVPLFAFLFLREKIRWPAVTGVLMAAVGLYLLSIHGSFVLQTGDALILGCAFCFALQIVSTGKFAPLYSALPLAIVQIGTVSVLSAVYAWLFEDWRLLMDPSVVLASDVLWALAITSIPATALAFLAQTALQKETSPVHVALIFSLEPVFAALTSYLWEGEVLLTREIVGCCLIFGGMIIAEMPLEKWWRGLAKKAGAVREG